MKLEDAEATVLACEAEASKALAALKKVSFDAAVAIHALERATADAYSADSGTAKGWAFYKRAHFTGRVAVWSRAVDRIVNVLTLDEATAVEWMKPIDGRPHAEYVSAVNGDDAVAHAAIRAIGPVPREPYDAPKAAEAIEAAAA